MWTVWGKTSPNSLIAYLPWWPFMHALVNIHILQGKGGEEKCSLNSPLRWPWCRSIWIFQEISSRVDFSSGGWVGNATQRTAYRLGWGLLSRRTFPIEAVSSRRQRKAELPGPGSQVLPPGLAGKEANTKKATMKEMSIWYFLRHGRTPREK